MDYDRDARNADKDAGLRWETLSTKTLYSHRVMELIEKNERAASGLIGDYVAIRTRNWVV